MKNLKNAFSNQIMLKLASQLSLSQQEAYTMTVQIMKTVQLSIFNVESLNDSIYNKNWTFKSCYDSSLLSLFYEQTQAIKSCIIFFYENESIENTDMAVSGCTHMQIETNLLKPDNKLFDFNMVKSDILSFDEEGQFSNAIDMKTVVANYKKLLKTINVIYCPSNASNDINQNCDEKINVEQRIAIKKFTLAMSNCW